MLLTDFECCYFFDRQPGRSTRSLSFGLMWICAVFFSFFGVRCRQTSRSTPNAFQEFNKPISTVGIHPAREWTEIQHNELFTIYFVTLHIKDSLNQGSAVAKGISAIGVLISLTFCGLGYTMTITMNSKVHILWGRECAATLQHTPALYFPNNCLVTSLSFHEIFKMCMHVLICLWKWKGMLSLSDLCAFDDVS